MPLAHTRRMPIAHPRHRILAQWGIYVATCLPLIAHLALLVTLCLARQWMFALMMGSALVGSGGTVVASLRRQRQRNAMRRDHASGDESPDAPISSPISDHIPAAAPASASTCILPMRSLEELLGLSDSQPWKSITYRWLCPPYFHAVFATHNGQPWGLDLPRQGPHALVAGTTGSGKSVLLQSWCLALCTQLSPHAVQFVFLDFKGGATFRQLARMPHTVGNVCDLDLAHAMRAIRALERELERRERMVATAHTSDIDALARPPARLVVMLDEFHALKERLPDAMERLMHIASIGRSLGIHLIVCTQHPMAQVSATMKANITLNLCLRVRDSTQSLELLGSPCAASISPYQPGTAYCQDGNALVPLRCAASERLDRLVDAICTAARFHHISPPQDLFTAPLPTQVAWPDIAHVTYEGACHEDDVPCGLGDDGVRTSTLALCPHRGNILLLGPPSRGTSTALSTLHTAALSRGYHVRHTIALSQTPYASDSVASCPACVQLPPSPPTMPSSPSPDSPSCTTFSPAATSFIPSCASRPALWLIDNADLLADPMASHPLRQQWLDAIHDSNTTVIIAVHSARSLRIPDDWPTRMVFPTADRATDSLNGIPASIINDISMRDAATPGRAVLIEPHGVHLMQCAMP